MAMKQLSLPLLMDDDDPAEVHHLLDGLCVPRLGADGQRFGIKGRIRVRKEENKKAGRQLRQMARSLMRIGNVLDVTGLDG